MSTWIESHQDLRSNPKTRRAARQLGTTVPALMGHLHCLWHWALDHAEDGDVAPFDAEDLADAAGWEGEAEAFVTALIDCGPGEKAGFLEPDGVIGDPEHGKRSPLALHDWWEYAGKLIAKRRRDAARKARGRAKDVPPPPEEPPEDVHGTSDGQDADGSADIRVTAHVPNPTEPNPTEPTEPKGESGSRGKPRSPRATRLPDGWRPEPEPELVEALGGQQPAAREFEKFCDYWRAKAGKDGRKTDWQATWRNWLRRAGEGRSGNQRASPPSHAVSEFTESGRVAP